MNAVRTAAVAALATGLTATACSAGHPTPTTVIRVAVPAPAPTTPAPADDLSRLSLPGPADIKTTSDDDPDGTPVEWAIHYLNDLRAGRWNAALDEMTYVERTSIGFAATGHLVGRDVLRHARGGSAELSRCTSGRRFAMDAVIVRCGNTHVVVHVETLHGFRGVEVAEFFVAGDHPGQPHTHAYSRLV
jgi:hypothetical protein